MLWSAFEELCALGADHEAQQFLALGGGVGGAAAAASSRLFSSYGAGPGTAPGAAAASAAAGVGSPSSSFPPVATPSVAAAHQCPGSPSGPAPLSTAATKTGLGAMFSWMDSGRQRSGDRGTAVRAGLGVNAGWLLMPACSRQPRQSADRAHCRDYCQPLCCMHAIQRCTMHPPAGHARLGGRHALPRLLRNALARRPPLSTPATSAQARGHWRGAACLARHLLARATADHHRRRAGPAVHGRAGPAAQVCG